MTWIHKTRIPFTLTYTYQDQVNDHFPHPSCDEELLTKKINRIPHIPSDSPIIIVHTQQLANHIPHLPYDLPVIVVPKTDKTCPSGFKKFWAKKQNII